MTEPIGEAAWQAEPEPTPEPVDEVGNALQSSPADEVHNARYKLHPTTMPTTRVSTRVPAQPYEKPATRRRTCGTDSETPRSGSAPPRRGWTHTTAASSHRLPQRPA